MAAGTQTVNSSNCDQTQRLWLPEHRLSTHLTLTNQRLWLPEHRLSTEKKERKKEYEEEIETKNNYYILELIQLQHNATSLILVWKLD